MQSRTTPVRGANRWAEVEQLSQEDVPRQCQGLVLGLSMSGPLILNLSYQSILPMPHGSGTAARCHDS